MEQLYLNTNPNGIKPVCHASQHDNNRTIRFHLLDDTEPITLTGTEVIRLFIRKANNNRATFEIANSGGTYIDLVVTTEMSDIAGDSECKFQIINGETTLGSLAFKMKIESDAYGDSLKTRSISGPIATFETDIAEDLIKLDVDLEPVQDLHGYDSVWPAGGGKNLLNMTAENVYDGQRYTATGVEGNITLESTGSFGRAGYAIEGLTIGETYTFSADIVHPVASGKNCTIYFNDTVTWQTNYGALAVGTTPSESRQFTKTIVATSTTLFVGFYITAGDAYGDVIVVKNAQVEKSSNVTEWAPYSNICPITGHDSAQLIRVGKNLFNNSLASATVNGTTIIVNEDKSVTISGTPSARVRVYLNNTDHLSFNFRTYFSCGTMPTGTRVFCSRKINGVADYPTISPRLPFQNNIEYYNFMLEINTSYDGTPFTIYPQLEVGSTATDYEPYKSDPTPVTVYFGQTVYKGTLYSELRKVLVTHVCETFDGSEDENWISTTTTSVRYGFRTYFQHNKKPTTQSIDEMLSSVIPLKKSSESSSADDDIITCRSTTYLYNIFYIFAPPSKISTVEELRAFLANEPETVMYPLNEPFYIDLSQEQTEDVERTAIASFETNIQRPLETSEHYFSCSQAEGTPTPDSPIPITGVSEITAYRTGKNLANITISVTNHWGTDTQELVNLLNTLPVGVYTISNKYRIDELPGNNKVQHGRFYITALVDGSQIQVLSYSVVTDTSPIVGKIYEERGTFEITASNKGKFNHAYRYCDQDTTHTGNDRGSYTCYDIQLEKASSATSYESYSGESITVSFGGTYYGGKFVQKEDGSRKLVLTHGLLSKAIADMDNTDTYPGWKNSGIRDMVGAGIDGRETGILNIGTNYAFNTKSTNDIVYLPRDRYNNLTQTQWIENYPNLVVQILVPLAEPIEVSLPDGDPLTAIAGENNVYCNTGDTALTYYFNMVADPIRIPALVGTNNVYSDAGDVDVEYYTTLEGGND